jgi:molecular chaperone GrpE
VAQDEQDQTTGFNGDIPEDADVEEVNAEEAEPAPEVGEEDAQEVIEKLMAQRDDYLEQLQRSRAEFINFRRRTEQERAKLGEMFTSNTLAQFLPVIDDFDRAVEHVPEEMRDNGWIEGILMIQRKLKGLLERAGVTEVEGVNAPFDPAVHEAVATEPGSRGEVVVEVYQKGYKLGDTLLRAAMVKTGDPETETENKEA